MNGTIIVITLDSIDATSSASLVYRISSQGNIRPVVFGLCVSASVVGYI